LCSTPELLDAQSSAAMNIAIPTEMTNRMTFLLRRCAHSRLFEAGSSHENAV